MKCTEFTLERVEILQLKSSPSDVGSVSLTSASNLHSCQKKKKSFKMCFSFIMIIYSKGGLFESFVSKAHNIQKLHASRFVPNCRIYLKEIVAN